MYFIKKLFFKLAGYKIHPVAFDKPNEVINNWSRELNPTEITMLDYFTKNLTSSEYGGAYDTQEIFAIFKNGQDTGIRFLWAYWMKGLCIDHSAFAFSYSTNKVYAPREFSLLQTSDIETFAASVLYSSKKHWIFFEKKESFFDLIDEAINIEEVNYIVKKKCLQSKYLEEFQNWEISEIISHMKSLTKIIENDEIQLEYLRYSLNSLLIKIHENKLTYDLEVEYGRVKSDLSKTEWEEKVYQVIQVGFFEEKEGHLIYARNKIKELTN